MGTFSTMKTVSAAGGKLGIGIGKLAYHSGVAGIGLVKAYRGTKIHKAGVDWIKGELGLGKYSKTKGIGTAFKWLGRGFVGLSAIQGYSEGGLMGAATATATHLGITYAFGAALKTLGMAGAFPIGVAGAVGGGYMAANRAAREHRKRFTNVEMGRPIVDQFGTISTMRQRSLMAMRNSKINSAGVIGNEAGLRFRPGY